MTDVLGHLDEAITYFQTRRSVLDARITELLEQHTKLERAINALTPKPPAGGANCVPAPEHLFDPGKVVPVRVVQAQPVPVASPAAAITNDAPAKPAPIAGPASKTPVAPGTAARQASTSPAPTAAPAVTPNAGGRILPSLKEAADAILARRKKIPSIPRRTIFTAEGKRPVREQTHSVKTKLWRLIGRSGADGVSVQDLITGLPNVNLNTLCGYLNTYKSDGGITEMNGRYILTTYKDAHIKLRQPAQAAASRS